MMLALPCRVCGRLACAATCLALGTTLFARSLDAQSLTQQPAPVQTVTAVSIGGMFVTAPMQPMLDAAPAGTSCGAGDCYRGTITVRANQRWQLQVRLDPAIRLPAKVWWRPPVTSSTNQPLDASWLTILTGPVATAGTDVALQFAVNPTSEVRQSDEPFHQLLSIAVQYRVVALTGGDRP